MALKPYWAAMFVAFSLTLSPVHGQDTSDMSADELIAEAETMHPAGFYQLASQLFAAGDYDEAIRWFYIGQLRYRFDLVARDAGPADTDQQLFSALSESVGRPINEYAFGDIKKLVRLMGEALAWDEAHPNGYTSKTKYAVALATVRAGLVQLRATTIEQRDYIREQREQNGLENR